jgi:hypothetical protein
VRTTSRDAGVLRVHVTILVYVTHYVKRPQLDPSNDEDVVESPLFGYRSVLLSQFSAFHYGPEDNWCLQGTFQPPGAQLPSVISLARWKTTELMIHRVCETAPGGTGTLQSDNSCHARSRQRIRD